jgi:large repetitive protein
MHSIRRAFLLTIASVVVPCTAWPQGDPLGPEFRVNTYTTGLQRFSSIASDSSGNFVVVWQSENQDGAIDGVFGQRYASSGGPLGPEFRVNTYTMYGQAFPSVATGGAGDFVVVWQSYGQDGPSYVIIGQRYASSGSPLGPEFRVNTYTTSGQSRPEVASDASGNFVVVWSSFSQDGATYGVFGQRYAASGAPLGPEFSVNTYTPSEQFQPAVASDSSGNFVVVWESNGQDGSSWGIFGQRYASSGAPLGPEFRVNTFTTFNQEFARVASDGSGNFVVVWHSQYQDGSSYGVFGQRYASSGSPVGPEFRANTFTQLAQALPSVASDSAGNFVVAWQSDQLDYSDIFGQRYASSGVPLGPEFRVNTYITSVQRIPSVAAVGASGNFVVVWESNPQDGSSYGVFGQRYAQIVPVELIHFGVE